MIYLAGPEDRVSGRARIIDGDTLAIDGRTIRLAGMDAPELHQTCTLRGLPSACGEIAREALVRLSAGSLSCRISGVDRYHRSLGRCGAGGTDVGAALVRDGLAVGYGAYAGEERAARQAGRGLWAGTFERPAVWRKAHPREERR